MNGCYCFWELLLTLLNTFSCFLIRWTLRSLLLLLLLLLLSLSRALSLFSMPCFFALMLLVGWFSLPLSVYVCMCVFVYKCTRATIAIVVIRAYYLPFHTPSFSSSSYDGGGLWWWWRGGGFTNHTPASEYRVCFIEVVARSSQTQRHSITQSTHMCVISVAWCVCYSVVDRKPFKCSTHSKPNQISFSWLRTVVDNERSFLSLLFTTFLHRPTRGS